MEWRGWSGGDGVAGMEWRGGSGGDGVAGSTAFELAFGSVFGGCIWIGVQTFAFESELGMAFGCVESVDWSAVFCRCLLAMIGLVFGTVFGSTIGSLVLGQFWGMQVFGLVFVAFGLVLGTVFGAVFGV